MIDGTRAYRESGTTPRRRTLLYRAGLSFLFATAVAATAAPAPAQETTAAPTVRVLDGALAPDVSDAVRRVDEIFGRFDSRDTPGCAVAVSERGHRVLSRAYGMADLEHSVPNSTATIFEAGSVSKQFTAAAVVLLALEGRLSLDDDVRTYVPEVPDYGETIRIRHLLTHTSGLRDWGSVAGISGWGRSQRTHDHSHVLDIVSRQSRLNFPPGTRYSYSNSGYNLLAVIVERVSGTSFHDFTRERIFEPLAMTNTRWRDDYRTIVPGRSSAYSERDGGSFTINRPIEHVHGNGGLLTTVGDLLIWNRALATGRIGGEAFVEAMHEPGVLNDGRVIHYAAGLQHGESHGRPVVQHTGSTSGYRAYLARFPGPEVSVALLCNVGSANPGALGSRVAGVMLGEAGEGGEDEAFEPAMELPGSALALRAGYYRSTLDNAPLRLVVEEGALRIDGAGRLLPLSETEFRVGGSERLFRFEPLDGAERDRIRATLAGGYADQEYVPVEAFDPSEGELEDFTGVFASEDAETVLNVALEDGRLVAYRRPGDRFPMTPIYTDAFQAAGFGLVRFIRDGQGRVAEISHSRGRVYDIRFARMGGEG